MEQLEGPGGAANSEGGTQDIKGRIIRGTSRCSYLQKWIARKKGKKGVCEMPFGAFEVSQKRRVVAGLINRDARE